MSKKILVTGSSRGIGKTIGEVFIEKKWDVCFTSRHKKELDKIKNKYPNSNNLYELINFTEIKQIELLYNKIQQNWGYLDSIIINVGSGSGEKTFRSSFRNNLEVFKHNFYSAYFSSVILSSLLKNSNNPTITFIGSIASKFNVDSPLNYASAKIAVENLAVSLSIKLSKYSVRVNVLHPGHTLTQNSYWEKKKQESIVNFNTFINSKTLIKEIILPEEIASFIYEITFSKFAQKLSGNVFIFDAGLSRVK